MANTKSGFNIGLQKQVTIIDQQTNTPYVFGGEIKRNTSTNDHTVLTLETISDPRPRHKIIPKGVTGTLTISRVNDADEQAEIARRAAFFLGKPDRRYTIMEEIVNDDDGSISEFLIENCVLVLKNWGDWEKEREVDLELDFYGQDRLSTGSVQ